MWVPIAGSVLFLAGTAAVLWWDGARFQKPASRPALVVHASEQDGRIRVDWDPSDPLVRDAKSATLIARDGEVSHEYPVSVDALRSGGLDYLRRSNDVLLTLRVDATEARVRTFVSPPPPPPPAPVAAPKPIARGNRARRR
jgi:hypothetical protein